MKKTWLIARATYLNRVKSGSFLIITFALPALMVIVGLIQFLTIGGESSFRTIGIIDQTGRLGSFEELALDDQRFNFLNYESRESAQSAFNNNEINGFLVIQEEYFSDGRAQFFSDKDPDESLNRALESTIRQAILGDAQPWMLDRLDDPSNRTFIALESGERVSEGPALIIRLVAPAGLAILMAFALLFTANQMGSAVVREKDQRTMEMVITSITTRQLVMGKVLGISLLSLTQIGIWIVGILVGGVMLLWGEVRPGELSIPWNTLFWALMLGVPGYFFYAVFAAGLGIIAGDSTQAQRFAGFLGFLGMFPLYFAGALVNSPDGPLAVGLSMFPLTAPIFSMFRMTLTTIPAWQLAASFALLIVSLLAGIWAVARIFRAAMLLYGKSMKPDEVWKALRLS